MRRRESAKGGDGVTLFRLLGWRDGAERRDEEPYSEHFDNDSRFPPTCATGPSVSTRRDTAQHG